MKRFIISALVALSAAICISSTVANANDYQPSDATVEYAIPGITTGSISLNHFHKIFDLMPDDIQIQAVKAFNDIINDGRSELVYGGVKVKHPAADTWEFLYKGNSIVVKNASESQLREVFTMPETL